MSTLRSCLSLSIVLNSIYRVLLVFNLVSVVLDRLTQAGFDPVPSFTDAITSILTSRLMLKLREYQRRNDGFTEDSLEPIAFTPNRTDENTNMNDSIAFSTVISPGASLVPTETTKMEIGSSFGAVETMVSRMEADGSDPFKIEECEVTSV